MKITDASGAAFGMKVGENKRAHTHAVTRSEPVDASKRSDAFNLNTGNIVLTANGTLAYIKNNEERDLFIQGLVFALGVGTFNDTPEIFIHKNPTAGDLITDKTPIDYHVNRNYGSNKTLTADIYKGKSGGTVTGGVPTGIFYVNGGSRIFAEINLTLPRGSSLGISIEPNLAAGSVKAYAAFITNITNTANGDS